MKQLLSIEDWVLQYRSQDVIDFVNEHLHSYSKYFYVNTIDSYRNFSQYSYILRGKKYHKDYFTYCIDEFLKCGVVLINIERNYINVIVDNTIYYYDYIKYHYISILHINYPKETTLDISTSYSKWLPRITSSETFINLLDLINNNAIECKTNYDFIKLLNNL